MKTARQLISAMAASWSPASHSDAYREELLALLRSKAPAAPAPFVETDAGSDIGDLMAALHKSVEAAKAKQKAKTTAAKRAG